MKLREIFWNSCPPPEVILTYPSNDMAASLSEYAADSMLQLPGWTIYKSIKSKLTLDRGYSKEVEREVSELLSRYIKWPHIEGLDASRAAFFNLLNLEDQEFVRSNWFHKEKQILLCHTAKWRNLACYSTQSNASYHSATREWINPEWDLGVSMKCFMRYIQDLPLKTAHDQIASRIKTKIGLDIHVFKFLIHKITILDGEWQKAVRTVEVTPEFGLSLMRPNHLLIIGSNIHYRIPTPFSSTMQLWPS